MSEIFSSPSCDRKFSQGLVISIGAHLAALIALSLKTLLFPTQPLILQETMRVDLIALPEKLPPKAQRRPQPKTQKTAQKRSQPPRTPPVKTSKAKQLNLKRTKTRQYLAMQRLKTLAALDKLKKIPPQPKSKPPTAAQPQPYKGNKLSPGSTFTGLQKLRHDRYLRRVKRHVKAKWFLPEWLARSQLRAQVMIKIDQNGAILEKAIQNSSGNSEFDKLVLEAVAQANPLPQPPVQFSDVVAVNGIVLGFPE